MKPMTIVTDRWPVLLEQIARRIDVAGTAAATQAFQQARGVPDAPTLLRLALVYAACGLGLRRVCAWAAATAVAQLSNPALTKRFQHCDRWLGEILAAQVPTVPVPTPPAQRIRLIDATSVCRPGATETTWRLHVAFDLASGRTERVEVTDKHGGERMDRVPPEPGVLDIFDAGYSAGPAMRERLAVGGAVLLRISSCNPRLLDAETGERFDRAAAVRSLTGKYGEWRVRVDDGQPDPPELRLIAVRKPPEACAAARRRVRKRARDKGRTPSEQALELADFVLLLTSLPEDTVPMVAVLALYRLRWQVELVFQRWKSLLDLDSLPAKTDAVARTWLLANLIAVVLTDTQVAATRALFSLRSTPRHKVPSLWHSFAFFALALQTILLGVTDWPDAADPNAPWRRHLCDPPRRRKRQGDSLPNAFINLPTC